MIRLFLSFIFFFSFTSCGYFGNDNKICIEVKDGNGEFTDVEFFVDDFIINELNIDREVIIDMCKTSCEYSDWSVKNRDFYYIDTKRINRIVFDQTNKNIEVWIHVGESMTDNHEVFTTYCMYFDLNGNQILKRNRIPKMYYYSY